MFTVQPRFRSPLPHVLGHKDYRLKAQLYQSIDDILIRSKLDEIFIEFALKHRDRLRKEILAEKLNRDPQELDDLDLSAGDFARPRFIEHSLVALRCNIIRFLESNCSARSLSSQLAESHLVQWFCLIGKVFRPGQYFVDSARRYRHDSVINHKTSMSSPRILGAPSRETNYYHTMSRIIERRFVFKNPVAAAKLRQIIFNQAAMSGVRVLTYTIMSNHFHLLLAVDEPEENRKSEVFRPGQYFVDSDRRCCHDSVINHKITMSSPRILGEPSRETNYYHTMSRIIERRFVFKNPVAAAKLRQIIFNQAAMSGVRVLTYTIMSNHFHLLLAVDEPEENRKKLDDEAILKRLNYVTRKEPLMEIRQTLQLLKQHSPERAYLEYRRRLLARMWDLSVFMKELKQRFSQWFNRRQHRRGPVWEDRFKSVLVEGEEHLLTAMAAYIDLNAVRAGIVGDPKEYRWCGYAEAVAGNLAMQSGLQEACGSAPGSDWSSCQADYRMRLVGTGEEGEELADLRTVGKRTRAGMRRQLVRKVMRAEGQLSWPTLLRCRIRYFTDGKVIGRRAFLEEVFARNRERMGVKREVGARRPRGLKLGDDWRTLTDLRGQVVL